MSQAKVIKRLRQEIAIYQERILPEPVLFKLWIESFRYSLTRASYAVSEFCDNYRDHYHAIPDRAKEIINKELSEAISQDLSMAGHQCDREEWTALYYWVANLPKNLG